MYSKCINILIPTLLFIGCASNNDSSEYEQEVEMLEAREEFESRQKACFERGGKMVIQGRDTRIRGKKFTKDRYKLARCAY